MAFTNYRDIGREYYRRGIQIMDLDMMCVKHGITYHIAARPMLPNRPQADMNIRILQKTMFSGLVFDVGANTGQKRTVTPSMVQLHAIDDLCVIIPSLANFIGAYRYIPSDDIPTMISSRMAYFRCPNIITAVSLALWLRSPRVIEAVREAFKEKKRMKEMTREFLGNIPIPEDLLRPDLVRRAMEIDDEIVQTHNKLNALVSELTVMSEDYA